MLCCNIDIAVRKGSSSLGCPDLKRRTVRVVFDAGDHEVRQVAVLVRYDVYEAIFDMVSVYAKTLGGKRKSVVPSSSMTFSAKSIEAWC